MANFSNSIAEFFKKHSLDKSSVVRGLLSLAFSLGTGFGIIYYNYQNYWQVTIYRTQTVDFNILANLLPHKVSAQLTEGDSQGIQETVDSNYGLFGIIITDCKTAQVGCSEQRILYASSVKVQSNTEGKQQLVPRANSKYPLGWLEKLNREESPAQRLNEELYVLLRKKPPMKPEWKFTSPRDNKERKLTEQNEGEIIGRAYLIRGDTPLFSSAMQTWLSKPFKNSSNNLVYNAIAFAATLTGSMVWMLSEYAHYKSVKATKSELQVEISERQAVESKLMVVQTENKLLRFETYNTAFETILEQEFSSPISNRLQQLDSILKNILVRVDSDAKNIVHDIYKAPLLSKKNSVSAILKDLESRKLELSYSEDFFGLLKEADESIQTLHWIVNDLRGTTRIESEPTIVQQEIEHLSKHLPPYLKDWIIDFSYDSSFLQIECNPWHLRSIVKNALYNSSSALRKHRRENTSFLGQISIRCKRVYNNAIIEIEDNGPGIPEEIISLLYESPNRLITSGNGLAGNGSTIVFAYLSLHGGKVEKMNLQTGAKVSFSFPLTSQVTN
jgi:signal transduction histidine kinase